MLANWIINIIAFAIMITSIYTTICSIFKIIEVDKHIDPHNTLWLHRIGEISSFCLYFIFSRK